MILRDKPLSFHWRAPMPDSLAEIIPPGLEPKHRKAICAIYLDAALEAAGADRFISYSRRAAFYGVQRRYHGTAYTFSTVPPAVDALAARGLIKHEKAPPGRRGWQSRFRACDGALTTAPLDAEYDPGELIRLKRKGELVDYRDTAQTNQWRRNLGAINETLGSIQIGMVGTRADARVIRFGDHAVYPAMDKLHRVFNNDWNLGGRLYGGWWQQVPKRFRSDITIDAEPTVEEDHPQLHPRLIYRLAGGKPDGDAYDLPGRDRSLCKVAFNVMVNAKPRTSALKAVAQRIGGKGALKKATDIVEALEARHASIADFFHSGIGLRLQNVDADMAERTVLRLRKQGIPSLPIHDSFIVRERDREPLLEAMNDAFLTAQIAA